ncbi:MAG TPA: crosslink repair DNA glycosylase YcaQ family protein, partial [Vicinamibacterales bacterium]|nr:crosslink repair DNA glycosylase YcaQ family protein [Vicinamibacterales bacterium]
LIHPRTTGLRPFAAKHAREAELIMQFVRERGEVHPREVNAHFARGTTRNYWGGQSNATTHLMSQMHYWGMLRITRRDRGIRVYAVRERAPDADRADVPRRLDALVDVAVRLYAPLPAPSLRILVRGFRYAVPQWRRELTGALERAKDRLARAHVDGADWYWPAGERLLPTAAPDRVRLLAPFDPVVSDRGRFEILWGWAYRFEAYTPARKRERGYYALPLLWRDRVVGWGNLTVRSGRLESEFGYVDGRPPRDRAFRAALDEELANMRVFLNPC